MAEPHASEGAPPTPLWLGPGVDSLQADRPAAPDALRAEVERLLAEFADPAKRREVTLPYIESRLAHFASPRPHEPAAVQLVAISRWVDDNLSGRDPEAITLHRLFKLSEEAGEVATATIGWLGANPRKGRLGTVSDVVTELADVAVAALAAIEHLTEHQGTALDHLHDRIQFVAERAGLGAGDGA